MYPLPWYDLPIPKQDSYKPYAVVKVCGNMSAKGYGFPSTVWSFSYLSQEQLYQIMSLFDDASDASVVVYIRTYRDTGGMRQAANFQATLYRPVDGSGVSLMPGSGFHLANVQIRFGHMIEV
jgi:hypothetical protein